MDALEVWWAGISPREACVARMAPTVGVIESVDHTAVVGDNQACGTHCSIGGNSGARDWPGFSWPVDLTVCSSTQVEALIRVAVAAEEGVGTADDRLDLGDTLRGC